MRGPTHRVSLIFDSPVDGSGNTVARPRTFSRPGCTILPFTFDRSAKPIVQVSAPGNSNHHSLAGSSDEGGRDWSEPRPS